MFENSAKTKIAIICGGPSLERGISLNSARSVMDHLDSRQFEIIPIYLDTKKNPYKISKTQLYSNTPSDFDFKLRQAATLLTKGGFVNLLRTADITFPIMHGPFGEDGGIQSFLEKHNLPFVGSGSEACKKAFDKFFANEIIRRNGFFALPSVVLKIYRLDHEEIIEKFFRDHSITRAVVKPASGGSSIGVFSVSTPREALEKVNLLFSRRMDTRVVLEPFAQGVEFTMVIVENRFGLPVALTPTEIETDYTENQIFDFRKKYLPTRQVTWHCPPRFDNKTIEKVQAHGEQLFALFGMRDFGRFDGWVSPSGDIWFCDFNPISGMEQNSFLFQQASRVGMTHSDILRHIVERACNRNGIRLPENSTALQKSSGQRKKVAILMGGNNSERQVSLMSGTNIWLKLRQSKKYAPQPYLLDMHEALWRLPYQLCLNHTVEEIMENCGNYQVAKARLGEFEDRARIRLGLLGQKDEEEFFEPQKMTLEKLLAEPNFVFIALHGGDGENGSLQKLLDQKGLRYNGSGEDVSRLCMDKGATSNFIRALHIEGIDSIPGKISETRELLGLDDSKIKLLWKKLKKELGAKTIVVKPRADGCSTGIAHLYSSGDLKKYLAILEARVTLIPKQTFKGQLDTIEMPTEQPKDLLFEKFIETDTLCVRANQLKHSRRTGWIEITIGVIEVDDIMKPLNPSITLVEGAVLTVEEKFQGGTGINITPPPASVMKPQILQRVKNLIGEVAKKIGIRGYARIDAFVNIENGNLLIIEVNTLPGLTPSTVFYHQALAEQPPIFPRELLEMLIQNKTR